MIRIKEYLKGWTLMRFLRFALGIVIVVQGTLNQEWMFAGIGGVFSLLALLNRGICGLSGSACKTPLNVSQTNKQEEVVYEEVK